MKSDNIINKYLTAQSTLEEEETLFQNENKDSEMSDWFAYVNQNRSKAPANLKDSIWTAIQTRKRKKRLYQIRLIGVAASVILLIGVFIFDAVNTRNEYVRKEALLNEAKSMFSEEKQTSEQQSILFENEMVIIYLADNNLKN